MTTTISLLRHGLVENPNAVYYGRLPNFGLAAQGRAQATAAGRYLADTDVRVVYHSPMLRARQTAEIVAAQLAVPVPLIVCDLLIEIASPYDGQTIAAMERRNWDFYNEVQPPYETPADILARMLAFFDKVHAEHPGQHIVGVSHGDPIAFAILWAFGRPATTAAKRELAECGIEDLYPAPASVSTFRFGPAGALLAYSYHCPHDEK